MLHGSRICFVTASFLSLIALCGVQVHHTYVEWASIDNFCDWLCVVTNLHC